MLQPRRRRLTAGYEPIADFRKKGLWSPLFLALVAAAIAALVMPQHSPFPYHFKKNGTWNYPSLQAPFDFEVLHPEDEVREQLAKVQAEHAPYYRLDPNIGRQQKELLQSFIEERRRVSGNDLQFEDLVKNPRRYQSYGQNLLDQLFSRGIASADLEALQKEDPAAPIFLVQNGLEKRTQARSVPSLQRARGFLIDTMPYSSLRQPELLLPILENTLTANVFFDDSLTAVRKNQKITAVLSTGISVRKGELVIKKGEWITEITYQKLNSLYQRYETRQGLSLVGGYALLAFIAFGLFFFWVKKEQPEVWAKRELLLLAPALILLFLLLLNIAQWIGPAVALLLPLWGLPLIAQRSPLGLVVGWVSWAILLLLTTISTDWSGAWLAIQMTGAGTLYFLYPVTARWRSRLLAVGLTAVVQILAWFAAGLASNVPPILLSADSTLFILAANGMLLFLLPLTQRFGNVLQR